MTTPSPFARSSLFDEQRMPGGRQQTVSFLSMQILSAQGTNDVNRFSTFFSLVTDRGDVQRPGKFLGD